MAAPAVGLFALRMVAMGSIRSRLTGGEDEPVPDQPPGDTTPQLINLDKVMDELRWLSSEMPNVAARALNKAMKEIKNTEMPGIVRETHAFKKAALTARLSKTTANRYNIQGEIVSEGKFVHLTDILKTTQNMTGVRVNVKYSTGPKVISGAFINYGTSSGKKIVLIRTSDSKGGRRRADPPGRYPIKAIYTPHPEHVYNAPDTWAKVEAASAKRLDNNIGREIDAEFRRLDGKW